nr:hypothetical protein BgiMline_010209 [Biomphalaria glabrata]
MTCNVTDYSNGPNRNYPIFSNKCLPLFTSRSTDRLGFIGNVDFHVSYRPCAPLQSCSVAICRGDTSFNRLASATAGPMICDYDIAIASVSHNNATLHGQRCRGVCVIPFIN